VSNFNYLTVNGMGIQINYLLDALTFFAEDIGVNLDNKSLTEKLFPAQSTTSLSRSCTRTVLYYFFHCCSMGIKIARKIKEHTKHCEILWNTEINSKFALFIEREKMLLWISICDELITDIFMEEWLTKYLLLWLILLGLIFAISKEVNFELPVLF